MITKLFKQNKLLSDFISDIQILALYLQSKSKKKSRWWLSEIVQKNIEGIGRSSREPQQTADSSVLILIKDMKTVVINGKTMRVNGSVSIINGKILCNGKPVEDLESIDEKVINISINGDVEKIDVDACDRIEVTGKVNYIKTMSGDIEVHGDVTGDVKTMSGDIDCGNVGGNASTMSGDVRRK